MTKKNAVPFARIQGHAVAIAIQCARQYISDGAVPRPEVRVTPESREQHFLQAFTATVRFFPFGKVKVELIAYRGGWEVYVNRIEASYDDHIFTFATPGELLAFGQCWGRGIIPVGCFPMLMPDDDEMRRAHGEAKQWYEARALPGTAPQLVCVNREAPQYFEIVRPLKRFRHRRTGATVYAGFTRPDMHAQGHWELRNPVKEYFGSPIVFATAWTDVDERLGAYFAFATCEADCLRADDYEVVENYTVA